MNHTSVSGKSMSSTETDRTNHAVLLQNPVLLCIGCCPPMCSHMLTAIRRRGILVLRDTGYSLDPASIPGRTLYVFTRRGHDLLLVERNSILKGLLQLGVVAKNDSPKGEILKSLNLGLSIKF